MSKVLVSKKSKNTLRPIDDITTDRSQ